MAGDELGAAMAGAYESFLAYARLLTRDQATAEDVVHEALVRCLGRGRRVAIRDVVPYVRRAIVNEVIRVAARRRRFVERGEEDLAGLSGAEYGLGSSEATIIEQTMLRTWLARLPARQRVAIVNRYYLDLSERETAQLLKCSVSAVKSLCQHGLQALRDEIAGPTPIVSLGHAGRATARLGDR